MRGIWNKLREYFSQSKNVILWIAIVFVLLSLWIRPKVEDYLELRELKAQYAELVDVEQWPDNIQMKFEVYENGNWILLEATDVQKVKEAITKLELDKDFDEKEFSAAMSTGMGMPKSLGVLIFDDTGKIDWRIGVFEGGIYPYELRQGLAMKNGQALYRVLEDLEGKYSS